MLPLNNNIYGKAYIFRKRGYFKMAREDVDEEVILDGTSIDGKRLELILVESEFQENPESNETYLELYPEDPLEYGNIRKNKPHYVSGFTDFRYEFRVDGETKYTIDSQVNYNQSGANFSRNILFELALEQESFDNLTEEEAQVLIERANIHADEISSEVEELLEED